MAQETFFGISFDAESRSVRPLHRDSLAAELANPRVFSWLDLQASEIGPLNRLLIEAGYDLELTSHFESPAVLPRIVERPDCLSFYLYEIEDPGRHLDARSISEITFLRMIVVLGADRILTFHRRPLAAVAGIRAGAEENFRLAGRSPAFVAFLLLQECLHDYAHLNLANDNYLDGLQIAVLSGERPSADLSTAGRNILTLKKLAASLQIVLTRLATRQSRFVGDEARASFSGMLSALSSVRSGIESSQHLLDGILGGLQAASAQRTSEIARVLTVISGVLLPMTVVTGIYGMNFRHMPELEARAGYFVVLAILAAMAAGLLLLFWRLGWLGRRKG